MGHSYYLPFVHRLNLWMERMTTGDFKNHVAIVTGASSGIGRALSLHLAGQGAHLSLAARDSERLDKLATACENQGGSAIPVPTDIQYPQQCENLIQETLREYGRIDMLVNNAGFTMVGKFEELPDLDLFQQVMNVNFKGIVQCTYSALPYLKNTQGRIVNVASLGGILAIPYNTAYIASKFAVAGFSESLRMELLRENVSVTVIYPYWVVTEFHERMLDKDGHPRGPAGRAIYTNRMMTADECAQIILRAALKRKREVVMAPGKILRWLKLIAPNWLDKIMIDRIFIPMVKRAAQKDKAD